MKVWSVSQDMLKVSWSLYWWPCHKFTAQSAGERILTISIWWNNRQECNDTIDSHWPIMCWCAIKKLLTQSLTDSRWPSFLCYPVNLVLTRTKDLLPNIHRMQGPPPPQQQLNGAVCHVICSHALAVGGMGAKSAFLSLVTLTLKFVRARDQTRLRVNLAQIRSAVPEMFEAQTRKSQTALKAEPYSHAVRIIRPHHSTGWMRPIATDTAAWSVGLSFMIVSSAKTAERIEMPFRMFSRVSWSNQVLD